jgi:hypothetical protein
MIMRNAANQKLAKEIRAEAQAWLDSLPSLPDSENGMIPIMEGAKAFKEYFDEPVRRNDFDIENEADRAILIEYLKEKSAALELIEKGLEHKRHVPPIDYSYGYPMTAVSLLEVKNTAEIIVLRGKLLKHEGKQSEALNEYMKALKLGRPLCKGPEIISVMIDVAIAHIGLTPLTEDLAGHDQTESDTVRVLSALVNLHNRSVTMREITKREYNFSMLWLADMIEGKIPTESAFESFFVISSITNMLCEGKSDRWLVWKKALVSWYCRTCLSTYVHDYSIDVAIWRKWRNAVSGFEPTRYYRLPKEAKEQKALHDMLIAEVGSADAPLTWLGMPNMSQTLQALVEIEVFWRGAIVLAAIRMFEKKNGRLPENLDELTGIVSKELLKDPFSGNNLLYRNNNGLILIYSVGYDSKDDGGTQNRQSWREPDMVIPIPKESSQ